MYYIYAYNRRVFGPFETESMAEDFRNSLIFDEDGESVPVVPIDFGDVWCDVDAEEIKVMHSDFE